jgi:6-phosphofructokinase 1
MRVITLPKTIDNDISGTDISFGFDTALGIATDAIDRLHSTAHSHHRIIVVEVMGHRAGWLALGAGVAGGADVILLPEIPYRVDKIAAAIRKRSEQGKHFSIVAIAEGSMSLEDHQALSAINQGFLEADTPSRAKDLKRKRKSFEAHLKNNTLRLAERLEALTGLEARVTILGHIQRGGTPSATDRLLATRLGTACTQALVDGLSGVMLAVRGQETVPVPLEEIAGVKRLVSPDDPMIISGKRVGTCFGVD